jgi:hypothetical protein
VRPPVYITLVLYAELASVKTLLVKGLYLSLLLLLLLLLQQTVERVRMSMRLMSLRLGV